MPLITESGLLSAESLPLTHEPLNVVSQSLPLSRESVLLPDESLLLIIESLRLIHESLPLSRESLHFIDSWLRSLIFLLYQINAFKGRSLPLLPNQFPKPIAASNAIKI